MPPSPGLKKQALLIQGMSQTLKSVSSNVLERFIDRAYTFSEDPSLNEVKMYVKMHDSICSFFSLAFLTITFRFQLKNN